MYGSTASRKVFLVVAIIAWITSCAALPAVHSFRGVSRYVSGHTTADRNGLPRPPHPRPDPISYHHTHSREYVLQGIKGTRPSWANALVSAANVLVDGLKFDFSVISHLLSPYSFFKSSMERGRFVFQFTDASLDYHETLQPHRGNREDREDKVPAASLPDLPQDSGFNYSNDKVRGVNIGNWLLFELWMDSTLSKALNDHAINAPGPNAIVDEWTAGLYSKYSWASHVLRKHFDTWITEQDFIDIKGAGLNHVRIPFPYWAFAEAKGPNAPYLTLNRFDKLIEACGWARTHGLKVWVDIHGVPGSQNGFDNSGHTGPVHWANDPDYYSRTQYTFNRLSTLFSQPEWKGVVTAIEAVNEPLAQSNEPARELTRTYYPWARNNVAKPEGRQNYTSLLLAMHDGFLGPAYWKGFFTGRAAHRVLLDTHPYFVYSDEQKAEKDSARLREVCAMESVFSESQNNYPTIAGEFAVNGPNGDRASDRDLPDGPVQFPDGPDYPYSKKYMAFMARNFAVQTATWDKGSGWIFWAWRNDNARDWSYQTGIKYGWIPKDATQPSPFGDDPCADYR